MTRKSNKQLSYVRHTGGAAWGAGVLVAETSDLRTYLFEDGVKRSFKASFCEKFIVPTEAPIDESRERLSRGLTAGGVGTPKAINPELEEQIRAKRDEPGPYLVYADWLQQRGDPRGDFIVAQHQHAQDPENKQLKKAVAALLSEHGEYFLPESIARACEVTWRMGFLERVRISHKKGAKDLDVPATVERLLRHPSAVFLRALVFGPLGVAEETSFIEVIGEVTKAPLALLEEVVIGDFEADVPLAFTRAGSLSSLLANAPALERLTARAGTVRFDNAPKHAALRELTIVAAEFTAVNVKKLFAAQLPALERLDVSCPNFKVLNELRTLVMSKGFPKLRHLALRQALEPALVKSVIEKSPLAAQLETIVLDDTVARGLVTLRSVTEFAPDAKSITAARAIARPDKWTAIGRTGNRIWGEYEGRETYRVQAFLDASEAGCNCGSPKDPCKHALALLLIATTEYAFVERPIPAGYSRGMQDIRPRYARTWE